MVTQNSQIISKNNMDKKIILEIKKQEDLLLKKIRDLLDSIIADLEKTKSLGKQLSENPSIFTVQLKDIHDFTLDPVYYDSKYQIQHITEKIKSLKNISDIQNTLETIVDKKEVVLGSEKIKINNVVLSKLKSILSLF